MKPKPTAPPVRARRIPRIFQPFGGERRTLYNVFERALAVTAAAGDAERHAILAYAFAAAFEVPQSRFDFALRRYKRGATLREAADELRRAAT